MLCSMAKKTRLMSKKQQKRNLKTRQTELCSHSVTGSPVFTHSRPTTHKKTHRLTSSRTASFQNKRWVHTCTISGESQWYTEKGKAILRRKLRSLSHPKQWIWHLLEWWHHKPRQKSWQEENKKRFCHILQIKKKKAGLEPYRDRCVSCQWDESDIFTTSHSTNTHTHTHIHPSWKERFQHGQGPEIHLPPRLSCQEKMKTAWGSKTKAQCSQVRLSSTAARSEERFSRIGGKEKGPLYLHCLSLENWNPLLRKRLKTSFFKKTKFSFIFLNRLRLF